MEGFGSCELDLSEDGWEHPRESEVASSAALVRGMLSTESSRGARISGFDMATCSDIPGGCGVSSSAAFEMLAGVMARAMFSDEEVDPLQLALDGVIAEREFFGKPSGAQDQLASAFGGAVFMDFSTYPPSVERMDFDPSQASLEMCLIDSRLDHAMFGDEFAMVANDMADVAHHLGCSKLIEIPERRVLDDLADLRRELGDRKILRALHFYGEVHRVRRQFDNISRGDWNGFIEVMRLSGSSSAEFLQNIYPTSDSCAYSHKSDACGAEAGIEESGNKSVPNITIDGCRNSQAEENDEPLITVRQPLVILALCSHLLSEDGGWRVHGGGFGGSVVAIMPHTSSNSFAGDMNRWLGYDAVMPVRVSQSGARAWRADASLS